jgi:hypothetical protein
VDSYRNRLQRKNEEYSPYENPFANFDNATRFLNVSPETILLFYMTKHLMSLRQMVFGGKYDVDVWDEKIGDLVNYLLILRAMVEREEIQNGSSAM